MTEPELSVLAVIRQHLDRVTVPECKAQAVCVNGRHCIDAGCCLRSGEVAVVPASQLVGAVEDREWLRGIVYEFLLTGPRKRTGLSDVEMQRFLSIHVGGQ